MGIHTRLRLPRSPFLDSVRRSRLFIMAALNVLDYSLGEIATAGKWHATATRDGVTELASGVTATDAWLTMWVRLDPDGDEFLQPDSPSIVG